MVATSVLAAWEPLTRDKTRKASTARPCLTSQRGLSGTKKRKNRRANAGKTPEPNIHRQPYATFHVSSPELAIM